MEVKVDKIVHEKVSINIAGATLLSIKETKALPENIRKYKNWWWLRTSLCPALATFVDIDGSIYPNSRNVADDCGCIRPALTLENLKSSNLQIGDRFHFNGVEFEVICDNLAFCTSDIGCRAFRDD